jgi:hypothetical protein
MKIQKNNDETRWKKCERNLAGKMKTLSICRVEVDEWWLVQ